MCILIEKIKIIFVRQKIESIICKTRPNYETLTMKLKESKICAANLLSSALKLSELLVKNIYYRSLFSSN